jgi:hypothetical protein
VGLEVVDLALVVARIARRAPSSVAPWSWPLARSLVNSR